MNNNPEFLENCMNSVWYSNHAGMFIKRPDMFISQVNKKLDKECEMDISSVYKIANTK